MEEQAGIYKITLYENKSISLTYFDSNTISQISNTGQIIEVENSDCETIYLGYSFEHRRSGNNKLTYKNTLIWKLIGLNDSSLDTISSLKTSIYGWVAVIEFYNGNQKIIEQPFRWVNSDINNNISNHYNIELKNVIYGDRIKDFNTLLFGLILRLDSDSVDSEDLTYNASGNLVDSFNNNIVVLDGNVDVVIGNYVRFGTGTSGKIYIVNDFDLGTNTLTLSDAFEGVVTDEYFWGGVTEWIDESKLSNNASQITSSEMPKLVNTNRLYINFDGINDNLDIENIVLSTDFTINFKLARESINDLRVVLGRTNTNSFSHIYFNGSDNLFLESDTNNNNVGGDLVDDNNYNDYVFVVSNNELQIYKNKQALNMIATTLTNSLTINRIAAGLSAFYFDGKITDFSIYNRVLTNTEINKL